MKTMYDVRQLLKRYGIFIYTGESLGDLELMESDLRELYEWNMVDKEEFQKALLVINIEKRNR